MRSLGDGSLRNHHSNALIVCVGTIDSPPRIDGDIHKATEFGGPGGAVPVAFDPIPGEGLHLPGGEDPADGSVTPVRDVDIAPSVPGKTVGAEEKGILERPVLKTGQTVSAHRDDFTVRKKPA